MPSSAPLPKKKSVMQVINPYSDANRLNHSTIPFSMTYTTCDKKHITFMTVYPGNVESLTMPPGDSPMHQHDYFELFYILDGEVRQFIESSSFHYHKGEALLMNRNIRHCEGSSTAFSGVFLNIQPEYIADILAKDILVTPNNPTNKSTDNSAELPADNSVFLADGPIHRFLISNLQGEEQFKRSYLHFSTTLQLVSSPNPQNRAELLLDRLAEELLGQKNGASFMISGLLSRLLGTFENPNLYHITHMEMDSNNEDFIFAHIVNYLKERKGNLSREELSHALHYHAEYLNQIVKRKSGMSLMQLGKTYRLAEAKRLLSETDLSISQIAVELGLVSRSHFYHFFEKETGMLPLAYRKQTALSDMERPLAN